MYFVRFGEACVRYTGKKWDKKDLPEDTYVFDYDKEAKWSLEDLERESLRTDFGGSGRDEDAHAAAVMERIRRKGGEDKCFCDDWDDVLTILEDAESGFDEKRRPIIFPDELSLPTRKLIREVAKIEKEEAAFLKKHLNDAVDDLDSDEEKEYFSLVDRGWDAREALLASDLGDEILDGYDPVEDMKIMAAQLLFMYAQTRTRAKMEGGKADEDLFYAGSNLYGHAVADQLADENAQGDDDSIPDTDGEEIIGDFYQHFNEYMDRDAGSDFLEGMDEAAEAFLKEKGFDIATLAGAKAAQKFLENAGPEDAFYTEGPVDNEMDAWVGRMRLAAMLRCVKARIEKMINGRK